MHKEEQGKSSEGMASCVGRMCGKPSKIDKAKTVFQDIPPMDWLLVLTRSFLDHIYIYYI